jgi:thioredoxin reductase (NADPH)
VVDEIIGDPNYGVKGLRLRNVSSEEFSDLQVDGVFISVGYIPNTGIFEGQLELDSQGYVLVDSRQRTSVEGVFASGDVHDPYYRQVVIASGSGAKAAMEAERFLSELEGKAY